MRKRRIYLEREPGKLTMTFREDGRSMLYVCPITRKNFQEIPYFTERFMPLFLENVQKSTIIINRDIQSIELLNCLLSLPDPFGRMLSAHIEIKVRTYEISLDEYDPERPYKSDFIVYNDTSCRVSSIDHFLRHELSNM